MQITVIAHETTHGLKPLKSVCFSSVHLTRLGAKPFRSSYLLASAQIWFNLEVSSLWPISFAHFLPTCARLTLQMLSSSWISPGAQVSIFASFLQLIYVAQCQRSVDWLSHTTPIMDSGNEKRVLPSLLE